MSYQHYFETLFADSRVNKLDLEIFWRARSCTKGYFDTQKRMAEWCGKPRASVNRSINRLIAAGYLIKTHRGFEPILLDNAQADQPQDPKLEKSSTDGTPDPKSGKNPNSGTKDPTNGIKDPTNGICTIYNLSNNLLSKNIPPKLPTPNFPDLFFTEDEREKLKIRYDQEDLELKEGLEILQNYAENRRKKFNAYTSHYRVMIGWVLDQVRKRETDRLVQERNRNYLEASKK